MERASACINSQAYHWMLYASGHEAPDHWPSVAYAYALSSYATCPVETGCGPSRLRKRNVHKIGYKAEQSSP